MPSVDVRLLPSLVASGSLAGRVAVVVDQLRATSTIARALAVGASRVVPCVEVEEARELAERLRSAGEHVVTGGERHGVRIEGFDLGNSPEHYTRELLHSATLVFTTTNGTAALRMATDDQGAKRVLACSLANAAASAACCAASRLDATVICAGTNGEVSQEDAFAAGALVDALTTRHGYQLDSDDSARIALELFRAASAKGEQIYRVLAESRGGRNLTRLGLDADIHWCASLDRYDFAVELNKERWELTSVRP